MRRFYSRVMLLLAAMILCWGGKVLAYGVGTVKQFSELSGYAPAGAQWKSNFTIDWDTQYLLIKIDATNCTGTNENLFTLTAANVPSNQFVGWSGICASGADNDDVTTNAALIHAYYTSGGSTINHYAFDASRNRTVDGVGKSFGSRSSIVYKISKEDGVQLLQSDGSYSTVATAATMTSGFFNSEMTIGSEEGSNRMHGTYTSVTIENIPVPNAKITNSTPQYGSIATKIFGDASYSPNGESFTKDFTIDWNTQKVVAEVDVTNSATKTEDIFSIGDDALSFNTVNIHLYRTATGSYSSYTSSGQNGCAVTSGIPNSTKLVNIELSKANGFVVNGKTVFTASQLENYSGIFELSNLKVGSGEGTNQQTKATYNYINVVTVDYAQATTSTSDVIKEATNNTFEAQNNVKVSLDRTISSSYWNTFCLPFAVSEEMVNDVFGSDCQIREYDNMDGTTMNFKSASSIEAGKPYLIKPASDVVNPTFTGVSIVAGDPVAVPTSGSYQMKGTYGLTDLATNGTNLFLGDQDKFYIPSVSGKTMKGMRAYFIVPSGTSATALRANIDGKVTAIDHINGAEVVGAAPVYNLQGQYVGTSLNGLPRGIYVQNGKKMVVR